MKIAFTEKNKARLEYLLSLEKATRLVGKSYEDVARNYTNSLQKSAEEADMFKKYMKLHAEIITELENYLNENI
jgi:hypothetical protein